MSLMNGGVGNMIGYLGTGAWFAACTVGGAGRWPLFWLGERQTVLPAFSAFTGGHALTRSQAAGSVACNGQLMVRLPLRE